MPRMDVTFNASAIIEGEVKSAGNGGHVLVPKKYIGRQVRVVILDGE